MTNKNFSMVDGKRIGFAPNLTPRLHRVYSVSIVSRQSLLPILLLCLTLFLGVGNAWGAAGDEITSIANIVSGKTYYIKGVRSSTTYYLTFTDATGSQSGTESSTTSGAVPITFTAVTGGYNLTTPNGYYIAPGTSNGKINVSSSAITVSASNQSSKIRLSIKSGNNTWSIQKNTSATQFGGYKNSGADITLIEAATCNPLTMSTVTATPGNQQITLSWSHVTNANSYTVTCKNGNTNAGSIGDVTANGTTRTCVINNLTNGTAYTWSVEPVGSGTYCSSNTPASSTATPNQTYDIIYYDKDGSHTTSLTEGANIATSLNALYGVSGPTSCDTKNYEYFVGWKDGEISGIATSVTMLSTEDVNATNAAKTYYAVWSDTEPTDYSTTYSSNVTGVSGVNVSIGGKSYQAKKLGSSGSGGSFTVTAPSGTTKLYLHAQGWSGKSASLTLSTNVGSISPNTAKSLTANSAISGSSTTFTLTTLTNDFFEYTLSNITSNATITIATQSERGVIWGVNTELGGGSAKYITTCCDPLDPINGSFS